MNEDLELLEHIYEDSTMGAQSMSTLISAIKTTDNTITKDVEKILKGYEDIVKETEKLLKKNKGEMNQPSLMAKMGSWVGIKSEILKDNSDPRVADMIIRGLTMGVLEMDKKIDKFNSETDKNIKDIAKKFRKFQQDSIELVKPYL